MIFIQYPMTEVFVMIITCHGHYIDVIMSAMVSQITNLTIVHSTIYSGTDQRKHQSSASLAFVLCAGNSPVTGEFPAQRASNVENVSIWWCHHISISPVDLRLDPEVCMPCCSNMFYHSRLVYVINLWSITRLNEFSPALLNNANWSMKY